MVCPGAAFIGVTKNAAEFRRVNKLTSILGGLAVFAIAIVFIVQFRPNAGQQVANGPTCAIEVRGACIPTLHFWASYRMLAPRGAEQALLRQIRMRKMTSEGLVERYLLNEDAKRLGITVSDDDLNAELTSGRMHISAPVAPLKLADGTSVEPAKIYPYLGLGPDMVRHWPIKNKQTGKFDLKTYEREVRSVAKMSPQEFRTYQKEELIASRMRDIVRSRVRIGESEAFARYSKDKSQAVVSYVRLDKRFYAELVADRSQKAIDAWVALNKEEEERVWNARKAQYTPECRVTRHILAKVNQDAADPDAEKEKAKQKIKEAKARLDKGESFADVAKALSEDGSADEGGMLGCVGKGKMVKPFEEAMFAAEAGKVVEAESQFGLHLIVVDKIAKDIEADALGRAEVDKDIYLAHESERLAAEAAKAILAATQGGKKIDDAVATHIAELEAKAAKAAEDAQGGKDKKKDDKKKDDKKGEEAGAAEPLPSLFASHPDRPVVETSLPFNASGSPVPGATPNSNAATMAFKLEKPGDVPSDIIELFNGYAVMVLKEKTPASKEAWEKDRAPFIARLRAEKQNDALTAYIDRLRNTLGAEIKFGSEFVNEPKASDTSTDEPIE
jgi:peptidyl-prolyl cis-trans isomerase D